MLVRSPAVPCLKASNRVAGVLERAVAGKSHVLAICRRVPLRGVLAVASLLATGGVGMWAVLSVAARLHGAG